MKLLKLFILLFISVQLIDAQDCKAYLPYEIGTQLEMTNYDKKDKITGYINQELTDVKKSDGATIFFMKQIVSDEDRKEPLTTEMKFKCKDNVFYIDMNAFIAEETLKAYENMEIKMTVDEIDIPANPKAGQKLKDGFINMNISGDMPMQMNMKIDVTNRKIDAIESITTPAGTFECVKLSQDVTSKMGFSMTINSITWYAEGVGTVRTESYKKGKLMGSTVLTKVVKP